MPLKLLICNLKENKTLNEMLKYKRILESFQLKNIELVLCPQFPYLPIMHSKKYSLGAQNVSEYKKGSYTGEVSAQCLKSLDIKYVIIGHYERELYFLENTEVEKKKIENALECGINVILPVGENLMEYQLGKTEEVIITKLNHLLADIPEKDRDKIIVAYEPIWRIGKNLPLNKKEILNIIKMIKHWFHIHGFPNNPVLYGGGLSLTDMQNLSEIDGFLLGKMSLDVEKMKQILEKSHKSTEIYKS